MVDNNNNKVAINFDKNHNLHNELSDGRSIYDKFKQNLSDGNKQRPGFMELVKNETGMTE